MELVKYFAGSRALGNFNWQSDLDFVQVYKLPLRYFLSGVPWSTWDDYPKDNADMYEIGYLFDQLFWKGNTYLALVMKMDRKESVSELWRRYEKEIKDVAIWGVLVQPKNRMCWVEKNMKWIERMRIDNLLDAEEVTKRGFWCIYWLKQMKVVMMEKKLVVDAKELFSEYTDVLEAKMGDRKRVLSFTPKLMLENIKPLYKWIKHWPRSEFGYDWSNVYDKGVEIHERLREIQFEIRTERVELTMEEEDKKKPRGYC